MACFKTIYIYLQFTLLSLPLLTLAIKPRGTTSAIINVSEQSHLYQLLRSLAAKAKVLKSPQLNFQSGVRLQTTRAEFCP